MLVASRDIYVHFDELDGLPSPNRRNYLFELDYFAEMLPENSSVLQVGSMDGARILRFLQRRPDLVFTGLEIEDDLVVLARENARKAGRDIRFVVGDITRPPADVREHDYVLCLNNTLGFIAERDTALDRMRDLGRTYVSVYGEDFDDSLAREYYAAIGIDVDAIAGDEFELRGVGVIRRFSRAEAESWGQKIVRTPIGYLVELG